MGKSSINGPFSMAMLNNQKVHVIIDHITPYWDIGMIGHQELVDHGDPICKKIAPRPKIARP